ncbi:MAG: biopolymer transporter ExbD [Prevotella sp.]|nr:biopolymer transporter ExbD [Prevotella sp.]
MFRKRYRQQIPELNTTSTADISFMLLIFFLVTSSMDTDKGLLRQMAPPPVEQQQPQDINKDAVLKVELDGHDQLTCDGEPVSQKQLADAIMTMASVNRTGHVVSVHADRETSYEAYFQLQNTIVNAYQTLREQYAQEHYGKSYARCDLDERSLINDYYPQRISEVPIQEGGNP